MSVWAPGIRLGPYELTAPLGAGGMGEVWKARDTRVDRVVAIKRLKAEHAERFKREARAIAALNHPHICQLYDVGPDYLVMEHVEGEILTGPVPVADAVRLAVDRGRIDRGASQADRASRSEACQHPGGRERSKAARLRPGAAGRAPDVRRCDYQRGVERARRHRGTVAYMSPEQARAGSGRTVGHVLLRGALRGVERPPAFRGATPFATITAVINERPPALGGRPRAHREPLPRQAAGRSIPDDGGGPSRTGAGGS